MKRGVITVAWVGVLLVVVAALVLPYFVGGMAESRFKARVSRFNAHDNGLKIRVDSYQRGFYSSQATVSLLPRRTMPAKTRRLWDLMVGSGEAPEFRLRINQGPIAFGGFLQGHVSFVPVLYDVQLRGHNLPRTSLFGRTKPTLYGKVYFGGAVTSVVTVPRGHINFRWATFAWQTIRVHGMVKMGHRYRDYRVVIEPLRYQAQDKESGKNYSGRINEITMSAKQKMGAEKFWIGEINYRFNGAEFKRDGKLIVFLKSGREHSASSESDGGRLLNNSSRFMQNGGRVKGWHFTKLRIHETVENINAAAFGRLLDTLRAFKSDVQPGPAELRARQLALRRGLEGAQLKATVKITSPRGQFKVEGRMAMDPLASRGRGSSYPVNVFFRHLSASVNLSFNRKIVESFWAEALGADAARKRVEDQVDEWVQEGLLRVGPNGQYKARIVYRRGMVAVNGKVIDGS